MRKVILLSLTALVLVVGGCEKQPNPAETPAATNAVPAAPAATNAMPSAPTTNGPVNKPGSGV